MFEPKVTQIVVEFELKNENQFFNMKKIAENTCDVIFDTAKFPGLRIKIKKTTVIFFSSGFGRILGSKSMEDMDESLLTLRKKLQHCGYRTRVEKTRIISMTATVDFETKIKVSQLQGLNFIPHEKFSGISVHINNVTAVVFHTGKINYFGAKNYDQILCTNEILLKQIFNKN